MSFIRSKISKLLLVALVSSSMGAAQAQTRLEREGAVIYRGLLPAAFAWNKLVLVCQEFSTASSSTHHEGR